MNKINVEKVIDYIKILDNNELLQDMDKILRNENTNLKLEIERLHSIIKETREEIIILETNHDIVDYQAQKLYQILDTGDKHE